MYERANHNIRVDGPVTEEPTALDMLRGRANNIACRIAELCDRMSSQAERMSMNIDRLSGQQTVGGELSAKTDPLETALGRCIDQGGKLGELDNELIAIDMQIGNAERGFYAMLEQAERLQAIA